MHEQSDFLGQRRYAAVRQQSFRYFRAMQEAGSEPDEADVRSLMRRSCSWYAPEADGQGSLAAGLKPILVHNRQEGMTFCEELSELLKIITE